MRGGFTHDPGEYLNRVGDFLRGMPVEHNVLLSNASRRAGREQINDADLWLWVEAGNEVVAAAQHTPPHGAYLSTGPGEAMRLMAQMLWEQRPWLPGVAGTTPSPGEGSGLSPCGRYGPAAIPATQPVSAAKAATPRGCGLRGSRGVGQWPWP